MYNTKQKQIILAYLINNQNKYLTINDIYDSLKIQKIGYTTIYRYLNILLANNIIQKYLNTSNKRPLYKYLNNSCNNHYHLKCLKCGKLIHLNCNEIKSLEEHFLKNHQFKIDNNKTTIYGVCNECNKK